MDTLSREKKDVGLIGMILVCNPLYLISTVLILAGMTLVVWDETFFVNYIDQVIFNISSIQVYQICLVVAAVIVARRKVKYDSLLLAMLDIVFWLIPCVLMNCMLFSGQYESMGDRGMLEWHVIIPMGLITVGLLAGRYMALRKGYKNLDIGNDFLVCAAPVILLNMIVPFIFRFSYDLEGEEIKSGLSLLMQIFLLTIVPVVFGLPNLKRSRAGKWPQILERQPWVQYSALLILAVMTVFHLEWVCYLYDLEISRIAYLPALWVVLWTFWNRVQDYCATNRAQVRYWLLFLPAFATPFILVEHYKSIALVPVLGNCAIYGYLYFRKRFSAVAGRLAVLSVISLVVSSLPEIHAVAPQIPGIEPSLAVVLVLGAVVALTVHNPFGGIFGAVGTIGLVLRYVSGHEQAWLASLTLGIGVFLLHSCLWERGNHYWQRIRRITALLASLTAFILCAGTWFSITFHISVLTVVAGVWWCLSKLWPRRDLLLSLRLLCLSPLALGLKSVKELVDMGAYGPVVVIGAFGVFACGVWASLRKVKKSTLTVPLNEPEV